MRAFTPRVAIRLWRHAGGMPCLGALALTALLCLAPAAGAHSPSLDHQQRALAAARAQAARRHQETAQARRKAATQAAQAAVLAQRQIAAAAALRGLEDQTAAAASTLAALAAQSEAAQQSLRRNEAALASLLPIMLRISNQPAAALLAVPGAPADAVRGIMLLRGIAGQIEDKAKAVHMQAQAVALLQDRTLAQQKQLAAAIANQQQAETALSVQISAARGAETRDLDSAASAAAAELAARRNVQTLQSMVDQLQARQRAQAAAPPPAPRAGANVLTATGAPVAGTIVQAYGAPTVAGPAVGIIYRAAPGARVAAPCSGPVLFADHFQNYGLLVILDCGGGNDAVLSGMHHLDVTAGQRLARGQPVGQMQGLNTGDPADLPMLYVELRRNGTPVDPTAWLGKGGSG